MTRTADWELGALRRWPPKELRREYPALVDALAELAADHAWPDALTNLLAEMPLGQRSVAESMDDLRHISAMIAMLVHLVPEVGADGERALSNARRRRTVYSSYPTPPAIGEVIARHVSRHLGRAAGPRTIFDPTIEGAAILLECAHVLRRHRDVRFVGIDREPAAVAASRQLFDRGFAFTNALGGRVELKLGDSLEIMRQMKPVDALVNNPPWGERRRNGMQWFPTFADPYCHFVERGLDLLLPGGPFGLVLPGQAIAAPAGRTLRNRLVETCSIDLVAVLPSHCFPRATVRTVLVLGRKSIRKRGQQSTTVVTYPTGRLDQASGKPAIVTLAQTEVCTPTGASWIVCPATSDSDSLRSGSLAETIRLDQIGTISSGIEPYRLGKGRPAQSSEILEARPFTFSDPEPGTTPILRGRDVQRFACLAPREFIRLGPHLAREGEHGETLESPRVFVRELCGRGGELVAAPAPAGIAPRYGLFSVRFAPKVSAFALSAVLNSSVAARYVLATCDGVFKESFNRIRIDDLRRFPVPKKLLSDAEWVDELEVSCRSLLTASSEAERVRAIAGLEAMVSAGYGV